jgi:hypothetical protein
MIAEKTLKSSAMGRKKFTTFSAYIEVRNLSPIRASGVSNPVAVAFSIIKCRTSMIRMKSCGEI